MITFDRWPWTRFTPEELTTFIASVHEDLAEHMHNRPTDPADFTAWAAEVLELGEALDVLEAPPHEREYRIRRARVAAYRDTHPSPPVPPEVPEAPPGHRYPNAPARKPGHPKGLLRDPAIVAVFYEELAGRLGEVRLPTAESVHDLANHIEPRVSAHVEDWQQFLAEAWVHRPTLAPEATAAILRAITPYVARERRRKAGGKLALAITAEAFTVGVDAVQNYIKIAEPTSAGLRVLRRVWRGTLDP